MSAVKSRKQQESKILTKEDLNPTNDVFFKFIFGRPERKQITIAFLNDLLEDELEHEIKDLTFTNPEYVPDKETDKLARLDISCVLDSGEKVDVEMQVANEHNIQKRSLFYWSRMYSSSLSAGDSYNDLIPCICINILDFIEFKEEPEAFISLGVYNNKSRDRRYMRDLSLCFLEIPKFKKKEHMTRIERWLAVFSKKLSFKEKEAIARKDPVMKDVLNSYDLFFSDKKERLNYINREMEILDHNSSIKSATEEGIKQGIEKGIKKGKEEGLRQGKKEGLKQGIAKEKENNFLAFVKKGLSVKMVAETIGLSKRELSAILNKHPELHESFVKQNI